MSHLPIFGTTMFQQDLEESYQVEVYTIGNISHNMFEFEIRGNDDFIDLNSITLHISAKITKADNNPYPAERADAKQEVAFINNVLHSMFSDVIVSINGTIVEGGDQNYFLKAFINTMFTFTE